MFELLKEAMDDLGITAYKLAKEADIVPSDLYQAIEGKRPMYPNWRKRIAAAIGKSEKALFSEAELSESEEDEAISCETSTFYRNIKMACKLKGIKMKEIESFLEQPGYLSRHKNNWGAIRLDIAYNASKLLGISIEDLIEQEFLIEELQIRTLDNKIDELMQQRNALKRTMEGAKNESSK